MRLVSVFLLLALSILAPGCALLGKPLEKPQVTVESVALVDASLSGVTTSLDLSILNPNAVAVPLARIDWELALAGEHAVSGRIDLSQEIPAKGSAPVTTTLKIGTMDAARVAPRLLAGQRGYALRADFHFATRLGDLSVTVEKSGTL